MIPRLICYIFGHDWILKGKATVTHKTRLKSGEVVFDCYKDNFFFCCHRCKEFKEYEAKTTYNYADQDSNIEVEQ